MLQGVTALLVHGLVLCVGPEGHTAVEWFAAGDCCPPALPTTALQTQCCDCTDAPLLQPVADKRDGDRWVTVSQRVPLAAPPRVECPMCSHYAERTLAPPAELLARRTIVLQA